MKIALIFPPASFLISQMVNPPLGIGYLSSYLKERGYTDIEIHHIIDINNIPNITADIIGIGFTTPQFPAAITILKTLKSTNPNSLFVSGGVHSTARPNECIDAGFDVAVVGEGEIALLDIVRRWEKHGPIEEIIYPKEIENIDDIPFPDYEGLKITNYKWVSKENQEYMSMLTSRGCPMKCKFCASKVMWKKLRLNSIEYVKKHIDYISDRLGIKAIAFQDDTFTINKKRLKDIVEYLLKKDMKFRCLARADNLDKDTVKLLKSCGCMEVCIGLESGNQEMLNMMDKRITVEQNKQAVLNCKEFGLSIKTFVLIGIPGESQESIEDTLKLLREVQPNDVDANVLILYPATEFYENMEKYDVKQEIKGYDKQYLKGKISEYTPTISTSKITSEQLEHYRRVIFNDFSRLLKNEKDKI